MPQRNIGQGCNALSAIIATLRGPARCRPLQQRCEVQSIATSPRVAPALPASATTTLWAVALPAIAATLRYEELQCNVTARHCRSGGWALHVRCKSDLCRTSVRLLSDVRPRTSVHRTSIHRSYVMCPIVLCPTPWRPTSCAMCLVVLRPTILCHAPCCPTSCALPSYVLFCHPAFSSNICLTFVRSLCVTGHSQQRTIFFKLYFVLEFCNKSYVLSQNFGAWDNTMSSDDESTTTQPEPRYLLRSNTQSFEPISLSSRSSRRYHQVSITPSSSSTTPTKNSSSGYTTSTIHQSPFGGVNQWGTPIAAPTFTPSPYPPLQVVTSTLIYTMEVSSSSGRIEKFNGRPCIISLKEFKATFSIVVCELEFKYGANYTKALAFKQFAHYVHYEALDVYKQYSTRILGVTQIPNLTYAVAIATTSQVALQVAIAHHGTMPNNPDPVPTLINLSPQQLIGVIANIPYMRISSQPHLCIVYICVHASLFSWLVYTFDWL